MALNNAANSITGSFIGNGANLTNVNAATLNGVSAVGFWQTGGNNLANGQILGSTNNQSLAIFVGGLQALLITTNPADSANLVGGSPANIVDSGVEGSVIAGGGKPTFWGRRHRIICRPTFPLLAAAAGIGFKPAPIIPPLSPVGTTLFPPMRTNR